MQFLYAGTCLLGRATNKTVHYFILVAKRDAYYNYTVSGLRYKLSFSSQLRKAEFILADAIEKGSDCIVTFGGIHSNHARTMALAAREVGLDSTLFIMTESPKVIM